MRWLESLTRPRRSRRSRTYQSQTLAGGAERLIGPVDRRLRRGVPPIQPQRSARRVEPRPAPVVARTAAAALPRREPRQAERARTSSVRPRLTLPLNHPGTEVSLPALPRLRVGMRLISLLLSVGLGALMYFVWSSPTFRVQAAEVSGLKRVGAEYVNAVLELDDTPVFTISPQEMATTLQAAFPEFSAVSVGVALPHTLAITVTERVPVITWKYNERTELVDEDGVAFPVRDGLAGSLQPLVVVEASSMPPVLDPLPTPEPTVTVSLPAGKIVPGTPAISHRLLDPEMVQAILAVSASLPAGTSILYDAQRGLGWKDPAGWEVYFGDNQDFQLKLYVYRALIQQLQAQNIQPVLVSVAQVHAPYYRTQR